MLDLDKKPSDTTVVVAMSGGVDSSTVAAMLHHAGYKVIGITLQLYDHGQMIAKKGACCAGQDIYDAQVVSSTLGIPHYILNYESIFKTQVIDDFIESYMHGETPLPCVRCNQSVKFKDLMKAAKDLNADILATGHYVRRILGKNGSELHSGLDPRKDQSYFLFATSKEQLNFLRFPLGGMTKEETRKIAEKFNLTISDKPDSQDICFVPDGNYADLVKKLRPTAAIAGKIMHIDGYELGTHQGIIHYTIGQRKGLGISSPEPLYVVRLDPVTNVVYVGPESSLYGAKFVIKEVNWIGDHDLLTEEKDVKVKIRSTHSGAYANLSRLPNGDVMVNLLSNERAITPGQACVIYRDERVLGGGWISRDITQNNLQ